jgi:hypothetical protein
MSIKLSYPTDWRFRPGQEQAFKRAVIDLTNSYGSRNVFEVENEEKEPGFPDTIEMSPFSIMKGHRNPQSAACFVEYKVSDAKAFITFKKSQPLFYRNNSILAIYIRAWSVHEQVSYEFTANEVLKAALRRSELDMNPLRMNIEGGVLQ